MRTNSMTNVSVAAQMTRYAGYMPSITSMRLPNSMYLFICWPRNCSLIIYCNCMFGIQVETLIKNTSILGVVDVKNAKAPNKTANAQQTRLNINSGSVYYKIMNPKLNCKVTKMTMVTRTSIFKYLKM